MNLSGHHVPGSKDTYYIPDFVTADEEEYLLRKVSPITMAYVILARYNKPTSDSGDTSAEMEATFESEVHMYTFRYPILTSFLANKRITPRRLQTWGECVL
jgi:hypothetical protein